MPFFFFPYLVVGVEMECEIGRTLIWARLAWIVKDPTFTINMSCKARSCGFGWISVLLSIVLSFSMCYSKIWLTEWLPSRKKKVQSKLRIVAHGNPPLLFILILITYVSGKAIRLHVNELEDSSVTFIYFLAKRLNGCIVMDSCMSYNTLLYIAHLVGN